VKGVTIDVTVERSFEEFFRMEYRPLVALGAAMTGRIDVGQELAQEAMTRTFQRWSTVAGYERPGAWARRVLVNLAIDANRRQSSERAAQGRVRPPEALLPDDPRSERLWHAVRALPDRQRAAVALYYLEDLSIADVARLLDIATGTVKASLAKARRTLAAALEPEDAP
jgi:RNA polymerase sigma-70 factor (ECF subfamily)